MELLPDCGASGERMAVQEETTEHMLIKNDAKTKLYSNSYSQ
jgi:hypothetical protein